MKFRGTAAMAATAVAGGMVAAGGAPAVTGQAVAGLAISLLAGVLVFRPFPTDALDRALGLFFGWAILSSILVTPNPLASKQTLGMWIGAAVLLGLVRSGAAVYRAELRAVLTGTTTVLILAIATVAALSRPPLSGGLFDNPNLAAAVLIAALPVMATVSSPRLRLAGTLATVGAILLTGSRAGLAALVVVTVVLLRGRARWLTALAAAGGGTVLLWWRFATNPDPLAWFRLEIWRAILGLTALHPVTGVSPGGLGDMSGAVRLATPIGCSLHARHIAGAESTFLGVLVRTGLTGALLALGVATVLLFVIRRLPHGGDRRAALAMVLGCLVIMVFHDVLQEPSVLWWWAVVVGFAIPRGPGAGAKPASWMRTLVPSLVVSGIVAWATVQPPLARWLTASSTSPETAARNMLRLEPWNDRAARAVASTALLQATAWDWRAAGQALYWSKNAVRIHPGAASDWALWARVNARVANELGAYPSAVRDARSGFERACRLEPHLPWYWNDWAAFERGLGNLEEARRLASRAVTEEPNFVRAWLFLARVDLDLGRVDRARADLEKARAARDCFRGRVLEAYERDLRWAPHWQWRQLEEAIP